MLLALPSLALPLFSDDFALVGYLEHRFAFNAPWWDLYRFTPSDAGTRQAMLAAGQLPWWTAPGLRLHLVRPLPSALLALDHALFGPSPLGWHVHSLVWYAFLLLAARGLFRLLLAPGKATLALLLYAFSGANVFPYAWPSARYGCLLAGFAALGITAHVRRRRDAWEPGRYWAAAAFVASLLCGEGGLGGIAFAVAYDLLAPVAPNDDARPRARVIRALPLTSLGLAYLALYAIIGGGAAQSGGYVSPLSDPVHFAAVAVTRLPALVGNALLGVPAELATIGLGKLLALMGAASALLLTVMVRAMAGRAAEEERAMLPWLTVGALGSIATGVGGFPGARELVVANLGVAAIVAVVLSHAFAAGPGALPRRVGAGFLVVTQLLLGPLVQLANLGSMCRMTRLTEDAAHTIQRALRGARSVYFLTASDPMVTMYAPAILSDEARGGRPPADCSGWLFGAPQDVTVVRTGRSTFSLTPARGVMLDAAFEELFRDPRLAFAAGDTFAMCASTVRVASVEGGRPAKLEVVAGDDLDAPADPWLAWESGELRTFTFPPVGRSVTVHWTPGPSGVF